MSSKQNRYAEALALTMKQLDEGWSVIALYKNIYPAFPGAYILVRAQLASRERDADRTVRVARYVLPVETGLEDQPVTCTPFEALTRLPFLAGQEIGMDQFVPMAQFVAYCSHLVRGSGKLARWVEAA